MLALVVAPVAEAAGMQMEMGANPIRKVVTMLQRMQTKVAEEGKKAEALYEKFMCYCKTGVDDLTKSIEDAETRIPALESAVEEAAGKTAQLEKDFKAHQEDRQAAETSMAEAMAIRGKEAAEFSKESAEAKANLAALDKATAAIAKGTGESFLQTSTASAVKAMAMASEKMLDTDRQEMLAFLSGSQGSGYAPQSGEILGIVKQMRDEMAASNAEATADEASAKKDYEEMMASKKKQAATLSSMIEVKLKRVSEIGVKAQTMKNDLEDTKESLAEDQKFLADLQSNCGSKTAEWEEQKKNRALEITALADTIKILNDDDALDTFKKTLPTASFIQLKATHRGGGVREQALRVIEHAQRRGKSPHAATFALIALSLRQKQANFDKVVKMVDDMMELLKKEQADDDTKKAYCTRELDEAEDQKKELETEISDLGKVTEEGEDKVAALAEELAALSKGMRDLDKDVAEATEQRKSEHADFVENLAANNAAKELLGIAKNRLNKFYNPTQYDPGVGPEMANEQERIARNFGVTLAQEPEGASSPSRQAPALVQVRQHAQEAEPKRKESQGVLAMIDELVGVLDKEIQEMKVDDAKMQQAYETTTEDAAEKRATDAKTLAEKEAVKADMEAKLHGYRQQTKSTQKRRASAVEFIKDLHEECDWLAKNYEARKSARAGEVESLRQAKAVLAGADYGKK